MVFSGTFTSGGLELAIEDGQRRIAQEGRAHKFLRSGRADHVLRPCGAAQDAVAFVTERCVFRLPPAGLELIEVAPGIDVDRDISAHTEFRPIVHDVRPMDPRIFRLEPMELRDRLLNLDLTDRLAGRPRAQHPVPQL